jgi:DNA invertase Pin-like site-specific DNA recombinase
VRTVETLRDRGVMLRSLREGIDYSTSVGRMVASIFASLAEYEREVRTRADPRTGRRDPPGCPRPRQTDWTVPRADPDPVRIARRMREASESVSTICSTLWVAHSTLYRALGDTEQDAEPAGWVNP